MTNERMTARELINRLVRVAADYSRVDQDKVFDFGLTINPVVRKPPALAKTIVRELVNGNTWSDIIRQYGVDEQYIRDSLTSHLQNDQKLVEIPSYDPPWKLTEGTEVDFQYDNKLRVGSVVKQDCKNQNVMIYEYNSAKPKWFHWDQIDQLNIIQSS